jgi:hypothetical protein
MKWSNVCLRNLVGNSDVLRNSDVWQRDRPRGVKCGLGYSQVMSPLTCEDPEGPMGT